MCSIYVLTKYFHGILSCLKCMCYKTVVWWHIKENKQHTSCKDVQLEEPVTFVYAQDAIIFGINCCEVLKHSFRLTYWGNYELRKITSRKAARFKQSVLVRNTEILDYSCYYNRDFCIECLVSIVVMRY